MHSYKVAENRSLTPSTTIITLESTDASKPFNFEPGQYAAISFFSHNRPTVARCFSIVSSPTQPGVLQFAMRNGGRFTRKISQVSVGDKINVRGPFGGFVLDWQNQQKVVFIAGGIGITPFMSMLRFSEHVSTNTAITLLFSCRNQNDIPFFAELCKLENNNVNITVHYVIAEGPTDLLQGRTVSQGRITEEIIARTVSNDFTANSFFICGPPPFMKGMTSTLLKNSTPQSNIITEAFGQGANRQTGKIISWPLNTYILGTAGLVLGSFVVLIADVMKTMPVSSVLATTEQANNDQSFSKRQSDLDALVNEFDPLVSAGPPSDAVLAAQKAAQPKAARATVTTTQSSSSQPAAKPAPVRTPVCTTSASGVRTCI